MNIVKRAAFFAVIVALLWTSIAPTQAQDTVADGATTVFLPMVNSGADLATSAATVDAAGTKLVAKKVISVAQQNAALKFWSRAAVAAAKPLAIPLQAGPATIDEASIALRTPTGPPGFAQAGAADPDADLVASAAYAEDWAAIAEELAALDASLAEPAGSSAVYTSYLVNQVTAMQKLYPHRWIGRLSFSTPSGTSYCSGTSISGNVLLTAAHCLYDSTSNQWYSNWVFSPAYRSGKAPYGTFPATTCWVLTAWINLSGSYAINSWAPHDVGVCKMGNNSARKTLNQAVGWMGRQWNWPYVGHYHTMGYPFRDYRNLTVSSSGAYLRTCVAESFQQASEVRGMGCNWGPGISGGPWIAGYAPGVVSGWADGVNSGLFIGQENMYAGRFNSNNIVPLCNAAGC